MINDHAQSNGQASPAHRGTIIVDSCFIKNLVAGVPLSMQGPSNKLNNFLDILPFLAEQGYKITIPESVVYEMTDQLLIDGTLKSVNDFFTHKRTSAIDKERRYYVTPLSNFFHHVAKGDIPNIEIAPIEDIPGEAADYIRKVKTAIRKNHGAQYNSTIRKIFIDLHKEKPGQLADRVIVRRIYALQEAPDTVYPIIVFTNDTGLLKGITEKNRTTSSIHLVNIGGMFLALDKSNLLPSIGFKTGTTAKDIKQTLIGFKQSHSNKGYDIPEFCRDGRCSDHEQDDELVKTAIALNDSKPFLRAMQNLAHKQETDSAPPPMHTPKRSGQIAKFYARYGNGNHTSSQGDTNREPNHTMTAPLSDPPPRMTQIEKYRARLQRSSGNNNGQDR